MPSLQQSTAWELPMERVNGEHMTKFLTDLRNSFWFVPTIIVLAAAGLSSAMIELDGVVGDDALAKFPRLFGVRADGARELLSAIASSTITVAGVVFSITIVALSLSAAQYSPRVLRNFMSDRGNQIVLGVFVGIYVYCLLVLRTVRGGEESFTPGISIVGALVLALLGVGFLIYFIHHIALSIQVSHIAARVAEETLDAMRHVYPGDAESQDEGRRANLQALTWHPVFSPANGYVQQVDFDKLKESARAERRVVYMDRRVGDFVVKGQRLMSASGAEVPSEEESGALCAAYSINSYLDLRQNPDFGVQQLVDIALKALSPGINDTGTARNMLNYLLAVLVELAKRCPVAEKHIFEDDQLVLVRRERTYESIVADAIGPIRRNSMDKPEMLLHILAALRELSKVSSGPDQHAAISREIAAIDETLDRETLSEHERQGLEAAIEDARTGEDRQSYLIGK